MESQRYCTCPMSVVSVVVVLKCSYSQASLKEQYGCSMLIGASFSIPVTSHDLFGLVWTCLERHLIPQAGIVIHPNSAPPACQRLVKGQEELRNKKVNS